MQTLSQQRSAKALDLLKRIHERGDDSTEFTQFCKSFPTMILQNGLGQALAFIRAKAAKDNGMRYQTMYTTLNAWLAHMNLVTNDVMGEIQHMDARKYMEIQTESLRFLEWIKRYETAQVFK